MLKFIKKWLVWTFSRRVGEAIDRGASYDEVCAIVEEEVSKW